MRLVNRTRTRVRSFSSREFHYRARVVDRVTRWCSFYFWLCCDRALCESRRRIRDISEISEGDERRARCSGAYETEISVTRNLFLFRGSVSLFRVRFEIVRRCGIDSVLSLSPGSSLFLLRYAFFRPFSSLSFTCFLFTPGSSQAYDALVSLLQID